MSYQREWDVLVDIFKGSLLLKSCKHLMSTRAQNLWRIEHERDHDYHAA